MTADARSLTRHQERLARASIWSAVLAGALGTLAVIGWVIGVAALAGAVPREPPMVPLTAVTVLLASVASVLLSRADVAQVVGRACAALVAMIGVAVLAEYVFAVDLGIDRLLFRDATGQAGSDPAPGRPSPNSAFCFVFLGLGLLLGSASGGIRSYATSADVLSGAALAIAMIAIVGYGYGADALHSVEGSRGMTLGAAAAIVLLAVAILLRPRRAGPLSRILLGRDAGAMLARRLLPAALLVPFVFGVLQRVVDTAGWVGAPMSTALRTTAEMVLLVGLTLVIAGRLRRIDAERERLVTAERRAKQLLDAVIDQIPIGVVLAAMPSGEMIRRNRMGEQLMAAYGRESRDQPTFGMLHWERPDGTPYTPAELPLSRAAMRSEVIEQEEMITRLSDGTPVHVAVSAAPVYESGEAVMAVAAFMDISTRRAAEQALAERDAVLRSFFHAADVMLAVVEADVSPDARSSTAVDYRLLMASARAAAVLGATESDAAGKTAAELGVTEDRRRSFVDLLAEVHRTGKPVTIERETPVESSEATAEGARAARPGWLSIVVSPLLGLPGRLPQFCVVATDVSRRRHLEEELRQAQKLEAIGRLAGGIAHDFNNLLTAITGFIRFALAEIPTRGSAHSDLEEALRGAERAGTLTHQLVAFSRQQVLQPQVLDLNQVVADIEPMLRRVIGEDIAVHRKLAHTVGAVRADRSQLEQVLVNLVVNARDAMPNGGVLTIETADVMREAPDAIAEGTGGVAGPHVMLAVTDTGVGMSAETRERIFEPFFTTKEMGRGTGLGLPTVFGIVKQSGGSIAVYSELGHGTTFRIYLPRFDGPADTPRAPAPTSTMPDAGRILLVEDDQAVRTIAARILRDAGYDVVVATTGREGLAKFRALRGEVDLIITDLVLPEMSGRTMIRELASQGAVPPVVYMSGYTAEAMSAQAVLESGDQFLEKPFTRESILAKVREVLRAPRTADARDQPG